MVQVIHQPIRFKYTYRFEDREPLEFDITLDGETLDLLGEPPEESPEWTSQAFSTCEPCELPADTKYCPLAQHVAQLIQPFAGIPTTAIVDVEVRTDERTYRKQVTLQEGLSSMMGIYMVGSSCPTLAALKPMLRFHLPFGTLDETLYRTTCAYLLKQYFRMKRGIAPDWDLVALNESYQKIGAVNASIAERLQAAADSGVSFDALALLDMFAQMVPAFTHDSLKVLEYLFPTLEN